MGTNFFMRFGVLLYVSRAEFNKSLSYPPIRFFYYSYHRQFLTNHRVREESEEFCSKDFNQNKT